MSPPWWILRQQDGDILQKKQKTKTLPCLVPPVLRTGGRLVDFLSNGFSIGAIQVDTGPLNLLCCLLNFVSSGFYNVNRVARVTRWVCEKIVPMQM
jgi:hypothetical protein